jgi:lysophospholipase L1-like esterase
MTKKISVLIAGLCWFVSSGFVASGAAGPIDEKAYKEPIRVACIGDSITAGAGLLSDNSYPSQLGRMLGGEWTVLNCGASGSTLLNQGDKPYTKRGIFKRAVMVNPNVVVIMLGTNDTKPVNWKFKDQFMADYKDLIAQFARLPGSPKIFLCRPACVQGANRFNINEAVILEQIPLIDKLADEGHYGLIDIHGVVKDHPELFPDKVHPNGEGSTLLAKAVYKALRGQEYTNALPLVIEKRK